MKKLVVTLLLAATCLGLCACGGNSTGNNDGTGKDTQQENNNQSGNKKEPSYLFSFEGMELSVNEDIEAVIAKLGEPLAYFEAPSCAFEGVDKIYTYASFQLDTYPIDGKDMLASIYFKDDLVATKEGISLYMSKDDMIKAYGEATTVNDNEYIYEKGDGRLRFILDGDEIISIEYQTKVEYK